MGEPAAPVEGDPDPGLGDGLADDGDGLPEDGDGLPEDGDGLAEDGDGEADELLDEDALAEAVLGTGGGGVWVGACWNSRIATRIASAHSSTISSQEARIEPHPARSWRPGQGSGHSLAIPGRAWSIQCSR